jgi:hypothetical protein
MFNLGDYSEPQSAARVRDLAVLAMDGQMFASLNFPEDREAHVRRHAWNRAFPVAGIEFAGDDFPVVVRFIGEEN